MTRIAMVKVAIFPLVADLEEIYKQGFQHAVLGTLLDAGSYASLPELPTSVGAAELLIGESFFKQAAAANVPVKRTRLSSPTLVGPGVQIFDGASIDSSLQNYWNHMLAESWVLSLVLEDAREQKSLLWALYGYSLPCMGSIPDCRMVDVWATWLRLAGGSILEGRFLLEESDPRMDTDSEERLADRLRQLYGE